MSLTRGAQLASLVALGVVTVVLVVLATTRTYAPPVGDVTSTASTEANQGVQRASALEPGQDPFGLPMTVSAMGTEETFVEGAWFYRAVPSAGTEEVQRGVALGGDGTTVEEMLDQLEQVVPGDVVLVALGSTELGQGRRPPAVVREVEELVAGIEQREGVPVVVLQPPGDDVTATRRLNRGLRELGEQGDVLVAPTFRALTTPEGTLLPTYTDDGTQLNEAGSVRKAEIVTDTLDEVVAQRSAG